MSVCKSIKTTCAYCGVGCGIEATVNPLSREVMVRGDDVHPSSSGRLCSKGSSLGETLSEESRLLYPEVRGQRVGWSQAVEEISRTFQHCIETYGPDSVAIYGSGQLLTEDYYVANKLMKGFIGTANIDTNSRLCMSSAVSGHKLAFGTDTVPACYDDLELADLLVLVGSNTAWCHPIIFQRIRAEKEKRPDLKVVVIDPRRTSTCDIADLHLALNSATDVALFNGLLAYLSDNKLTDQTYLNSYCENFDEAISTAKEDAGSLSQIAELCGVTLEDLETFYQWFGATDKTVTLYSQGVKQSSAGVDKVSSILNCHLATGRVGKPGSGPLSLTGQPNAMGGREVGGLANQLASHLELDRPVDRQIVSEFWGVDKLPDKAGLPAVDMFDAVAEGKIKAIWIMATNPVVSLPNADKVKQALKDCEFVVVSDCAAQTDTLALADVKLPALGWSEKDGMVTNSERYITHQRALLPPAGEAKPDWWIISQVAKAMGFDSAFDYAHQVEIFREHAALSGVKNNALERPRDFDISALKDISLEEYEGFKPVQWPINKENPQGTKRFFENGLFYTPTRKASLRAVAYRAPGNLPDKVYPLVLNTGRLRDQWHTMTRSALSPRLNQHRPEPFVEVHPDDAQNYMLSEGAIAHLRSIWGQMYARIRISDAQQKGTVFVPMHWSEQYARNGRMGALVNPVVDPISNQPESKHTPIAIRNFDAKWHGFVMSRRALPELDFEYVVKVNSGHYIRTEMAGTCQPESWEEWFAGLFDLAEGAEWQTYSDESQGIFRCAAFDQNGALLLIANVSNGYDKQVLPERNWLGSMFEKASLEDNERVALLSGLPTAGTEDVGAIVCSCFNVGELTIKKHIEEGGLTSYQEVGKCCKAGTNCGSCVPEIKAILKDLATKVDVA